VGPEPHPGERAVTDRISRRETRERAIAAFEETIHAGLAEPGEFDIRELDDTGKTVRVLGVADESVRTEVA
jgi:hypothetical protein